MRNRRRRHLFRTPPGRLFLHPTPSSSALLQPATSCPQTMLINKGVNDRSRDLVLGPAGQTRVPPLLSATTAPARSTVTTLLSPYQQCFCLGVQSYTPAPHSPDTRRWPPNPRTPSRPAQGSNPLAQCAISRTAEPFPPTLRRPSSNTSSPKHGRTGSEPPLRPPGLARRATPASAPSQTPPPHHGRTSHVRRRLPGGFLAPMPSYSPSLRPGGRVPRTFHHRLVP